MALFHLWSKISANYCFDVSFESLITGLSSYSLRNTTSEINILIRFLRIQNNNQPTCSGFLCPFLPPARHGFAWALSVSATISLTQASAQTLVYEASYNLRKNLNPLSKSMPNLSKKLLTDKVPPGTA